MTVNRNKLFMLVTFCFCILLVGCSDNKEEKVNGLKTEATAFLSEQKYDEAIAKYEEILTIIDDPTYQKELDDIKKQKEYVAKSTETIKEINNILTDIQRNKLAQPKEKIHFIDVFYMLEDLKKVTSGIEDLKVEGRSNLATYISQVKLQHAWNYSLIKVEYNKDFNKSAEVASRKDANIEKLFGGEGDKLRSFLESGVELESFVDTIDALDTMSKDMTIYAIDLYVNAILDISMPS